MKKEVTLQMLRFHLGFILTHTPVLFSILKHYKLLKVSLNCTIRITMSAVLCTEPDFQNSLKKLNTL